VVFIDANRERWGIEPICEVLQFASSTYFAARSRPPSRRSVRDDELKAMIKKIHEDNLDAYGVEKVWRQLHERDGVACGRDRVARLMRALGLRGVTRARKPRTTIASKKPDDRPDLVKRDFSADGPNCLWVADITYVSTFVGFCYTAFIIDVFARYIVGWKTSTSLRTDLCLDALEMAIFSRRGEDLSELVHHSDRGVQYLAIRYTERLAACEAVVSVGTKGDSYDNALAETVNGLYKAELIYPKGPWRSLAELERATAGWVEWWNCSRLHGALGWVPPAEHEEAHRKETRGGKAVS